MGRNTVQRLVHSNIEALEQILHFLSGLNDENYTTAPSGVQFGIGRHVRHILDMYLALKEGLSASAGVKPGLVDYDLRARDSKLESDLPAAKLAINQMLQWLRRDLTETDTDLRIKTEVSIASECSVEIDSNLKRELSYLSTHTVHHLAYIAILAQNLGLSVDDSFGIAPATMSFQRAQKNVIK
ncbi:DinB family protein [Aurantivibrio infirmus]